MELSEGICPFFSGITLSNIDANLWRIRFLKLNIFGLIHRMEDYKTRHQSVKALK